MERKWIFLAPLAVLAGLLFVAFGGVIVQQLWNWLLPPLFGFRQVTFWQALGMLVLCRILFGGFGGHRSSDSRGRKRIADRIADRVSERVAERWEAMTPEERERVRRGLGGPPASESHGQ
jgi:hypothetical protein